MFGKAFFYDVAAEYISDIRKEKAQGGPWLTGAVLGVGLPFGMVWIAGMMLHKWGWADIRKYTEVAGQGRYVLMPSVRFVYSSQGQHLGPYQDPPMAHRQRRTRYQRRPRSLHISAGKTIEQRPAGAEIAGCINFGHWEGDLMMFRRELSQHNATSPVER
jgi:hypothetical protein